MSTSSCSSSAPWSFTGELESDEKHNVWSLLFGILAHHEYSPTICEDLISRETPEEDSDEKHERHSLSGFCPVVMVHFECFGFGLLRARLARRLALAGYAA